MRVYGAVNNPFILTKYTGQDPENFGAIDNNFIQDLLVSHLV